MNISDACVCKGSTRSPETPARSAPKKSSSALSRTRFSARALVALGIFGRVAALTHRSHDHGVRVANRGVRL